MGFDARRGSAMASVLFTDLVDSTALRSRVGDEAADAVRRTHDEVLSGIVASGGGVVVKSLGDGLMAVFDSAADAVAAAVRCQQAVAAMDGPEPLVIRVGVSVGDVTFEDDDCHGSTVNEAARLCAAAQGGQILVADLVRAMARGRGGFVFEPVGVLELKGLVEPVSACTVGWEPLRAEVSVVGFPSALKPPTTGGYVGRDDVRLVLAGLWDETKNVGARTALLVGEPGIGKTRTAYEVARAAHDGGAVVLFGRCDDELRVPYQPFVEALEWQHRHAPHLPLGRLGGELTRLVPDVGAGRDDLSAPIVSDARTEEHRLFEATAAWLCAVADEGGGLVLVVDDLHWATKPTLFMLVHLVRAAAVDHVPLLVVGTYRDTDLDRTHPLSAVLGDLRRIDGVHRIPVDPLDSGEVLEFVEQAAGHHLDDPGRVLASRVHDETEGNPFFVAEVLRYLIDTGAVRFVEGRWVVPDPDRVDVPEGVRDVVGQRLSRLSDTVNEALRAAAAIGRDFDVELVAALADIGDDALLDALDEASRARLIEETGADRFRFTHALVRTTLYDELSASRRRRLHRRIVDLLAERRVADLAALAHHAVEAGPRDGDLSLAIGYVIAAGEHAQAARAHGEAETYFAKAVELLDEDDQPDTDVRISALISLGETRRDQGDPTFRETLLDASQRAITARADDLLLRAVLANTRGSASIIGDVDTERVDMLEIALQRSASATTGDQARLLATLARELIFDADSSERRLAMADRAIAIATESDDAALTAAVLATTQQVVCVPERWTDQLQLADTAVAAADVTNNPSLRLSARDMRTVAYLSRGDLRAASESIDDTRRLLDVGAGPFSELPVRFIACQFLAYEGRFDDALATNDDALETGERFGVTDAPSWWAAIAGGVANLRGRRPDPQMQRHESVAEQYGALADQYPGAHSWRTGQVLALAEAGRLDESRATLEHHQLRDPTSVPRDLFWLVSMHSLAKAAQVLADAELGRHLTTLLEPHNGAGIHYALFLVGTVEQNRAHAAAAQGLIDDCITHLRNELEWARANSPVFTTSTGIELAEQLIERQGPGDHDEARTLLRTARPDAERMAMHGWLQRADTALASLS
jgi:class 3 adenylate cyclase/tetratricopeptide (TPR) repeat protein